MDSTGSQGDLQGRGLSTQVSGPSDVVFPPGVGAGGGRRGAGSRTHLDTAVVSIPVCTGGQALQRAHEAPTVLPGWTFAVHNLEGLGMVRRR